MSWDISLGTDEPLRFETEATGSGKFVTQCHTEKIRLVCRWTLTEDSILWSLKIDLRINSSLNFRCESLMTPSLVYSLYNAVPYEISGLPPETLHAQQFMLVYCRRIHGTMLLTQGEYLLFGVSYSFDFMRQWSHKSKVVAEFTELVRTNRPAIAGGQPSDMTDETRCAVEEILNTVLHDFHLQNFLRSRSADLMNHAVRRFDQSGQRLHGAEYLADIQRIHELHDWTLEHLDHAHTLISLSRRAGMNISKMQRLFHHEYGKTVIAFIRHRKLMRAKQQLEETSVNQKTIAAQAGYRSLSAFTQAFSTVFRKTPSSVRSKGIEKILSLNKLTISR